MLCLVFFFMLPPSDAPLNQLIDARVERDIGPLAAWVPRAEHYDSAAMRQWLITLGQIGHPEAAEWIQLYFRNPNLQRAALFAYGEIDGARVEPLFELAPLVDPANRLLLVEAISKLAGTDHNDKITPLWETLSGEDRAAALFFLWRQKPDSLTAKVLDYIQRGPSASDIGYVYYLFRSRTTVDSELLPIIFTVFKDDPAALIYATRIGVRTPSEKLDRYFAALCRHEDWRVRVNALNALQTPKQRKAMGYASLSDVNPNVVRTALRVLVGLKDPDIYNNLATATKSFSPSHLQTLVASVPKEHAEPFLKLTTGWLTGKDAWRQRQGIALLRQASDEDINTKLQQWQRRYSTGEAVVALRTQAARNAPNLKSSIEAAFRTTDPYLLAAAVTAMASMDGEKPIPFARMRKIAKRPFPESDFHYALVDRRGQLTDPETAKAMLEEFLEHPDYLVRYKAWQALDFPDQAVNRVFASDWRGDVPPSLVNKAKQFLTGTAPDDVVISTAKGDIRIRLEGEWAPVTSANLLHLAEQGFHKGMPIHRVVPNFVVQIGDNRGDGSGGPGYAIPCEVNPLRFDRGKVGMALAGKDTGGSQFFICHSAQPHLDGGYTIFGEVIEGMDVVDMLEEGDTIQSIQAVSR